MNKQELRKLIRESIGNSEEIYVTENIDADVYLKTGVGPDDYFTSDSKAKIHWVIDVEKKSYGIKEMFPVIKKIELDLELWREDAEEYERIEKVFDNLTATDGSIIDGFKLKISKDGEQGHMFPTSISIDENGKSIDIYFDMP